MRNKTIDDYDKKPACHATTLVYDGFFRLRVWLYSIIFVGRVHYRNWMRHNLIGTLYLQEI